MALWVGWHPGLLLLLLTPLFLFNSALLSSRKSSIFQLVSWSKMLAKTSAFMSIIFIVETQIINRRGNIWPLDQKYSFKSSGPLAELCDHCLQERTGYIVVFSNQFPRERGSCSGSCLVPFVEITLSLHMCTYLGSFCLDYISR